MPQSVKLKYTIDIQDGDNYVVLNLPSGLTISQRKLHRACLDYTINGGYIYDTNNNCRVKIGAAPDNWVTRSAIRRVRNAWLKMHEEPLKLNPQLKPKWHDFKMMLTRGQAAGTTTTYNVPEDIADVNLPYNEAGITWSNFVTQDNHRGTDTTDRDEFTCHLLGGGIGNQGQWDSVSAIESWYQSRPDLSPETTISPAEADTMESEPITLLFDAANSHDEIIENFQNAEHNNTLQEGDIFPMYDPRLPPNTVSEVAAANTHAAAPISYFTGFNALLGQVWLHIKADVDSDDSAKMDILFDVDPRGATI